MKTNKLPQILLLFTILFSFNYCEKTPNEEWVTNKKKHVKLIKEKQYKVINETEKKLFIDHSMLFNKKGNIIEKNIHNIEQESKMKWTYKYNIASNCEI